MNNFIRVCGSGHSVWHFGESSDDTQSLLVADPTTDTSCHTIDTDADEVREACSGETTAVGTGTGKLAPVRARSGGQRVCLEQERLEVGCSTVKRDSLPPSC